MASYSEKTLSLKNRQRLSLRVNVFNALNVGTRARTFFGRR